MKYSKFGFKNFEFGDIFVERRIFVPCNEYFVS